MKYIAYYSFEETWLTPHNLRYVITVEDARDEADAIVQAEAQIADELVLAGIENVPGEWDAYRVVDVVEKEADFDELPF